MAKPVFVLLHGAWHTPRCWSLLIPHLTDAGYEAVAPALPSSGSNPPTPDWSADVTLIRETVSSLVDQDRDVVVVMHSFSGMTGGTALEGLDKASRTAQGLEGGVVRLIYLVAFIVAEGFQHSPYGTRDGMVPQMQTDFEVIRTLCRVAYTLLTIAVGGSNHDPARRCQGHVSPGRGRQDGRRAGERVAAAEFRGVLE
jgi:pimeloyl-ACP methyl ester carboxylesterase